MIYHHNKKDAIVHLVLFVLCYFGLKSIYLIIAEMYFTAVKHLIMFNWRFIYLTNYIIDMIWRTQSFYHYGLVSVHIDLKQWIDKQDNLNQHSLGWWKACGYKG